MQLICQDLLFGDAQYCSADSFLASFDLDFAFVTGCEAAANALDGGIIRDCNSKIQKETVPRRMRHMQTAEK